MLHPVTKKPLRLELVWDGSTTYLRTRKPTNEELKKLPVIVLTLDTPYDPKVSMNVRNIRRMVTHRNRAFAFHEPADRKLAWTPELLAVWRARLNDCNNDRVKKTFNASTQLYPEVAYEKSSNPKKLFPRTV